LVCTVAVNGLNNFQVGFVTAIPTAGDYVDPSSYTVCGTVSTSVVINQEIRVDCVPNTELYQYVIIQSLDTEAEMLCMADVCVYEPRQYAIEFILVN